MGPAGVPRPWLPFGRLGRGGLGLAPASLELASAPGAWAGFGRGGLGSAGAGRSGRRLYRTQATGIWVT